MSDARGDEVMLLEANHASDEHSDNDNHDDNQRHNHHDQQGQQTTTHTIGGASRPNALTRDLTDVAMSNRCGRANSTNMEGDNSPPLLSNTCSNYHTNRNRQRQTETERQRE